MIRITPTGGILGAEVEGIDIGALHDAVADYSPDEPRLIKRCQVMADHVFGLIS